MKPRTQILLVLAGLLVVAGLVTQRDGEEENWKLLADTWQLVHEPIKLNVYVKTEVRNCLNGAQQPAGANQSGLPPVTDVH